MKLLGCAVLIPFIIGEAPKLNKGRVFVFLLKSLLFLNSLLLLGNLLFN